MLGFDTFEPAAALWLCLAASVWCVGYGLRNWNNKGYEAKPRKQED
ncbi:symporter small accessory protein [Desulfovibrio oxyclinae]|jgi:hypothetical protein|nr:symporter small accessory protein [Desulfovibrio oxyclinae]